MGELVVGEAGFFGAEEESDLWFGSLCAGLRGRWEWLGGCVQGGEDERRDLLEWEDGLRDLALADGRGSDSERAVGDG